MWTPERISVSWSNGRSRLDRLLAIDRELDDRQRTVALDLATMVTPRTARFYAAVAVLTSAIHTRAKSCLIMRLSCGNTLKSPGEPAPFGCGSHQAFPQVIRSAR